MSLKGERRRWKNQRKEVGRQKLEVREHETGRKKEGERETERKWKMLCFSSED